MSATTAKQARKTMVDCQIRPNDVTDLNLIDAFYHVPREAYVSSKLGNLAYIDSHQPLLADVPHAQQRFLLSPMALAKLLGLLNVERGEKILVVGANTGYSAAVLHQAGARVVALEENLELVNAARQIAANANLKSIEILEGKLFDGAPSKAPFDGIVLEGAVEDVPQTLLAQLKPNGKLVCVLGAGTSARATVFQASNGVYGKVERFNLSVPALPGFEVPVAFEF